MSTSPFHHKNSKYAGAMPLVLLALNSQDDRMIKADSETAAADKCITLLRRPAIMGRSVTRRSAAMRGTIGVMITRGLVTFSPSTGLRMTDNGRAALETWRSSRSQKSASRNHGRQSLQPSRA